jgi:hypothetical protein
MLVKVEVPVSHSQTLLIPASSLVQRSELRAVYVLDSNGNPRLRQVRTGKIADGQIEILAGVSAGEQVVVNAAELLGSARLPLPSAQEQKP